MLNVLLKREYGTLTGTSDGALGLITGICTR